MAYLSIVKLKIVPFVYKTEIYTICEWTKQDPSHIIPQGVQCGDATRTITIVEPVGIVAAIIALSLFILGIVLIGLHLRRRTR